MFGTTTGRYAVGLPTGLGKSTAITALLWAAHNLHPSDLSAVVCVQKVDALCALITVLTGPDFGVPRDKIALLHSYECDIDCIGDPTQTPKAGMARMKSDTLEDAKERPYVFVTHARATRGENLSEAILSYNGNPRSITFYDESLMRSEAVGIRLKDIQVFLQALQSYEGQSGNGGTSTVALCGWLATVVNTAEAQLRRRTKETAPPERLEIEPLLKDQAALFVRLLERAQARAVNTSPCLALVSAAAAGPLHLVRTPTEAVLQRRVLLPETFNRVLVTDASYPIRTLCHLDRTLSNAEDSVDWFKSLGTDALQAIKRWDNVRFHVMRTGGGRSTLEKDLRRSVGEQWLSRAVVDVVSSLPRDEACLLFTYKQRSPQDHDFAKAIRREMRRAGIDPDEVVPNPANDGKSLRRFNFRTWGQHDSSNDLAHCSTVILCGVMHRDRLELAATAWGQLDEGDQNISGETITNLQRSEIAHLIYQAASRGACRTIGDGGFAKRTDVYVIHRDLSVFKLIKSTCPGAKFSRWEGGPCEKSDVDEAAQAVGAVLDLIEQQSDGNARTSVKALWTHAALDGLQWKKKKKTRHRALADALMLRPQWDRGDDEGGRSLVLAPFFSSEEPSEVMIRPEGNLPQRARPAA